MITSPRARSFAMLLAGLLASACTSEDAALVPEARAVELVRATLAARGIAATDTGHALAGIAACDAATPPACETVAFTLDGWDPSRHVGFEYVADDDPDFGRGTRWSDFRDVDFLQAAVDASLAGTGDVVLMIHQWAHETEQLAEDQLVGQLEARLDALGL